MASILTHTVVGLSVARTLAPPSPLRRASFYLLAVACSVLPDADVIAFSFDIPYGHWLGHRGFSHSLVFAALVSVTVMTVFFPKELRFSGRWWWLFSLYFAITASHGFLDAFTNGGKGIAFFSPIDRTRYFFPVNPIQVSPISVSAFLGERGIRVLRSEIAWVWGPCLGLLAIRLVVDGIRSRGQRSTAGST